MVDFYLSPADASNKDIDVSVTYVSVTDPVEDVAVINGNQIFIKQPANITIRFTAKDKPNAAKVDLSIVFPKKSHGTTITVIKNKNSRYPGRH